MWAILLVPAALALVLIGAIQLFSEFRGSDKTDL